MADAKSGGGSGSGDIVRNESDGKSRATGGDAKICAPTPLPSASSSFSHSSSSAPPPPLQVENNLNGTKKKSVYRPAREWPCRSVEAVVASTRAGGFGHKGDTPWPRLGRDMARFGELTTRVCVPQKHAYAPTDPYTRVLTPESPSSSATVAEPLAAPSDKTCNAVVMGFRTFLSLRSTKFFANSPTRRCIVVCEPRASPVPSVDLVASVATSDLSSSSSATSRVPEPGRFRVDVVGVTATAAVAPPPPPPPFECKIFSPFDAADSDHVYDELGTRILRAPTLRNALERAWAMTDVARVFMIGGARHYRDTIEMPECTLIHHTQVLQPFRCDTFIPAQLDPTKFELVVEEPIVSDADVGVAYQWLTYRQRHPEEQYLDTVRRALESGSRRLDRTGTGTRALFGCVHRYSCRDGALPLLTTKRMFFRGVAEELKWLLRGETGGRKLLDKGVRIWEANGTRKYLESIGQGDRAEHDLGPIYGHQWRFFGAPYTDCDADYKGQGVDQLQNVLRLIKTQPHSRRILLSAWNPLDLSRMALPPCHVLVQFYVDDGDELSCCMYQRSADLGLGVPFNVASYALLLHLVANHCALKPGEFVHVMGDTHVYEDHVTALREQTARAPRDWPTLRIKRRIDDIAEWEFEADLELVGYHPHPALPMKMSA